MLVQVGISGDDVIFDCNDQERLCIQTSLLLVVNRKGEVLGVETIGPAAGATQIMKAIQEVADRAKYVFTFYGFK